MKDFASAAKLNECISELYDVIGDVSVSDIEELTPVLDPKYVKAFTFVKKLFTGMYDDDPTVEETPGEPEDEENDPVEEETVEDVKPPTPEDRFPWRRIDPNIKWRKYDGNSVNRMVTGYMISNTGLIWDISAKKLVEPYWYMGDMRLRIPAEYYCNPDQESPLIRVSIMVCKAFRISSESTLDKPVQCVIRFVDGDRRNVKPTNLQWVHKSDEPQVQPIILTTIDICQRLVDFDGDIDKTFELYDEPSITRKYIEDIRNKMVQVGLSDKYFLIDKDGNFIPNKKEVDAAEYYEQTHDAKMAKQLIMDKLKESKPLTEGEKRFLLSGKIGEIRAARDSKRKRQRYTAEVIVDEIRDETGAVISTDLARTMMEEVK